MNPEWPVYWGACGICDMPVGSPGWLVWDRAERIGTFACGRHLMLVKRQNPGGSVEEV